jgi:hypothetical protein
MHDARNAEIAVELERHLPGWLVLWAPYHRRYTAFGACTVVSTIIDDPDPNNLIARVREAELAAFSPAARGSHRRGYE